MVLYCARGQWTVIRCLAGICYRYIQQRCPVIRMCDNCSIQRRMVILARLHSVYRENRKFIKGIVLWTIGTKLKNTVDGRKTLSEFWKYFRSRMNKKAEWEPLFRVVEAGSKGKRLHIHFLNNGFLSHKIVLQAWREVTRENSNVNFSDHSLPPEYALRYAAKYLSKDASKYSFLGIFYGKSQSRSGSGCNAHGEPFIYYQSIEDKKGLVGQKNIENEII